MVVALAGVGAAIVKSHEPCTASGNETDLPATGSLTLIDVVPPHARFAATTFAVSVVAFTNAVVSGVPFVTIAD